MPELHKSSYNSVFRGVDHEYDGYFCLKPWKIRLLVPWSLGPSQKIDRFAKTRQNSIEIAKINPKIVFYAPENPLNMYLQIQTQYPVRSEDLVAVSFINIYYNEFGFRPKKLRLSNGDREPNGALGKCPALSDIQLGKL